MKHFLIIACILLFLPLVSAAPELTSSGLGVGEIFHNETRTHSITFTNTGDVNLTNLDVSSASSSDFIISFSPSTVSSLDVGESTSVEMTFRPTFSADVGDNVSAGSIEVKADQDTFTFSPIEGDVRSYLDLVQVRVEADGDSFTANSDGEEIDVTIRPLDEMEVQVELENLFERELNQETEINDVEVSITIFDIDEDGDDLEIESDQVDLDFEGDSRKHVFRFDIEIPPEAEDENYDMEIKVDGEDDEGRSIQYVWFLSFEVERLPHELIIEEFSISPEEITCEQNIIADVAIMNIGKDDEDFVRYTIINRDLGIDFVEQRVEIPNEPEDEENIHEASIPLLLKENIPKGSYPIRLSVFYDSSDLEAVSATNLEVGQCGAVEEEPEPIEEEEEEVGEEPVIIIEEPEEEEEEKEEETSVTQPTNENEGQPTIVGTPVKQANMGAVLLLVVVFAVILLAVLLLIILIRK